MWNKIREKVENRYDILYPELAGTFDYKGYTAHRFRHHFCSMLHDAGVPAIDAQKIIGHSDVSVTLGIYTHFDEDKAVQMSHRMNKLLDTKPKVPANPDPITMYGSVLENLNEESYKIIIADLAKALKEKS